MKEISLREKFYKKEEILSEKIMNILLNIFWFLKENYEPLGINHL